MGVGEGEGSCPMKILSWNIRGLRADLKKRSVLRLVRRRGIEFVAILECKLASVSEGEVKKMSGFSDFGWCLAEAVNLSGVSWLFGIKIG